MPNSPRLQVRRHDENIIVVRLLDKRLSDPMVVDSQRAALKDLLQREPASQSFVLDFELVSFLVTNALNNLLVFNAQISRENGRLVLCRLSPALREIFRRTYLEGNVFEIVDTLEQAIETLRS
jgi:anti-anti-sigma factor